MNDLAGKHIVLGLTGGIACYKAAELCRALIKEGRHRAGGDDRGGRAVHHAGHHAGAVGRTVYTSQWDAREPNNMPHINLSREADAILIAPCSADFMARLVHGRADELLSLMCLARPIDRVPLLLAPAMNREMWAHPATQRNMAQLAQDGATILGVGSGFQACGETGDGRMLEPPELLEDLVAFLQPKPLAGKRVVVTAGPDLRGARPDSRHHQPLVRQDGLRHRPRRARGRRRGHAGRRPGAPADAARRAPRRRQSAREMLEATLAATGRRRLRRHRGGGRLAAGDRERAEDQEGRQRRRRPPWPSPRTPTSWRPWRRASARRAARCSASASPPRATTCWPRAGQARAQGHPAAGGQHRPAHLRPGRQPAAAGRRARHAGAAARPKLELARTLVAEIARRLATWTA
jgi:phosphopantothenoylcysteine decarboxylase/phosphopantothenate--cysteine ligase